MTNLEHHNSRTADPSGIHLCSGLLSEQQILEHEAGRQNRSRKTESRHGWGRAGSLRRQLGLESWEIKPGPNQHEIKILATRTD
jgi:hypothetical protein